jgi:hypothetical protein
MIGNQMSAESSPMSDIPWNPGDQARVRNQPSNKARPMTIQNA